jgi:hypothetical protein
MVQASRLYHANSYLGVTDQPLFSMKGCNKKAQGNALGPRRSIEISPERAQQLCGRHVVAPFQG